MHAELESDFRRRFNRDLEIFFDKEYIHGVGGMGKTALAQAFAYKEADAFPGGSWLPRCDRSAINTSCSSISQ